MDKQLTGAQLTKIIERYTNSQYITNDSYYRGENPTLINKEFEGKPDHRIPLPFARRTVDDVVGYAYKPGNVIYQFGNEQSDQAAIDKINEILEYNDESIVSGEIFQDALIKGEGAELHFVAEGMPQFVQVPREQCIFVYKNEIRDRLDYAIRYYKTVDIGDQGQITETYRAEVYYTDRIDYYSYVISSDDSTIDQQHSVSISMLNTDFKQYKFEKTEPHYYGAVPLFPYKINVDRLGVFQPSISLIDILDDFGSESIANSIDRFNDTLMLLSKKMDQETADNIKQYNIFDDLGPKGEGHFVEYLNRQIDIMSTVEGFKLFERLYYELTGVPNLRDEQFGNKSGIAIMYALIPFENKVATYEMYFTRGLIYRIDLLNNICKVLYNSVPVFATTKWTRNLPFDLSGIIQNVVALNNTGLVSNETLLKLLPDYVISDIEAELKKVEEQKQKNIDMFSAPAMKEPQLS